MASKLLNLLALSSLAILVCSFGAVPVTALSPSGQHLARRIPAHDAISKRKRGNVKRCRSSHSSSGTDFSTGPSTYSAPSDDSTDGGPDDSTPPVSSNSIESVPSDDSTYGGPDDSSDGDPDDSDPPSSPPSGSNHHSHGSNTPSDSNSPSDGGSDDSGPPSNSNSPSDGGSDDSDPPSSPPSGNNHHGSGSNTDGSNTPNSSNTGGQVTPASSSGGTPSGSGKAGLAWPNGEDDALKNFKTDHVTMVYTWSPFCPSQSGSLGFKCIPMLWGTPQIGDFQNLVVQGYADTVFGFNEPNEQGQANLSPEDAAGLWQQYIDPLKNQGYRLISPATSSNPAGMDWMHSFFNNCNGCQFDGVAVHWYDVGSQNFIDYINLWHNTYNKDIWVTEFACQNFNGGAQCSESEIFDFMSTVTHYMDDQPWIAGYFAFGVMRDMQGVNDLDKLMNDDGTPTALGTLYINDS